MKNYWTEPKIKTYPPESTKPWYIWFRFNGGNPIIIRHGLNKIADYEERLKEAQLFTQVLSARLEKGWIPNSAKFVAVPTKITTVEAVNYGFDQKKKSVSNNTKDNLQCTVNFFINAAKKLKIDRLLVANFNRAHAKMILDLIQKEKSWTNKNYNKHLGFLRSIFYEVLEGDFIDRNPFGDIKNLKVIKTVANIPPTDEEMISICNELKEKNYGFYIFYMMIYYCGIRPEELRNLKIKNLDFDNKMINLEAMFTKTKKDRVVPMVGSVYELLLPYQGMNPDYYIFGTWVTNGGRHSSKKWFTPNLHQIKEDTPNKQWHKLIKDGLGINKTLYSAKHKGADDKLAAGMELKTICDIFGHSETEMTERYMHSLKKLRFNEALKVKMKMF